LTVPNCHFLAGSREQRLDEYQGAFHGASGEQKLGNKIILGLEEAADFVHSRDHGLLNQVHGRNASGEGFLGGRSRLLVIAIHDSLVKGAVLRHRITSQLRAARGRPLAPA
jgi:hypothetical protein